MINPSRLVAVALALSGLAAPAVAQPAPRVSPGTPTAPSDPIQVQAPVPALAYRSALQSYRPWREQGPGDWRALNDEVTRIGGWRSYLREVQQTPEAPARTAPHTPALATSTAPAGTDAGPAPHTPAEPAAARKGHAHGHH